MKPETITDTELSITKTPSEIDTQDKEYVAEAFGDIQNNPLRLPSILMYCAEIIMKDTGADELKLKSTTGIHFIITRRGSQQPKSELEQFGCTCYDGLGVCVCDREHCDCECHNPVIFNKPDINEGED